MIDAAPEPRIDEDGVSWCWSHCPRLPLGLPECLVQSAGGICLPSFRQMALKLSEQEKELERLRDLIYKLRTIIARLIPIGKRMCGYTFKEVDAKIDAALSPQPQGDNDA